MCEELQGARAVAHALEVRVRCYAHHTHARQRGKAVVCKLQGWGNRRSEEQNQKVSNPERIPSERASQEEQNGANFSSVATSSEELRVCKEFNQTALLYVVHGFRPKTAEIEFSDDLSITLRTVTD